MVSSGDPIQLNGFPEGGVFSGPSVAFNIFNPSQVLPGFYEITYTYLNDEGCSIQVSENILVAEITYNFVTYNLGTISPKIMLDLEILDNGNQPITVSNLNGSIIFNTDHWFEKGNQQFTLDTHGWHKGIYLIKIGQQTKPEKVYVY